MQVRKHEWQVSKTGILIRDVHQMNGRKLLTGISEHGMRIHFPASFLDGKAGATEISRIEQKEQVKEDRRTRQALRRLGTKLKVTWK